MALEQNPPSEIDLNKELSIARNAKVPRHLRTQVVATMRNVQIVRATCPGTDRTPAEVYLETIKEEKNPRIKGFCADQCGAGLTWNQTAKQWTVGVTRV